MNTREPLIQSLLGQMVHIQIDRPLGFRHGDIRYPINYGFLPGVIAGDGEAQDAYVLGVDQPLSEFYGQVIGVIRRTDDVEDKLVVAPQGLQLHQGQIAQAVHFQEQYFSTTVESIYHKSCGVVPFRKRGVALEFLILLQASGYWSFPKGHMESGETETQTALRELREETGLTAVLIPEARTVTEYPVSSIARKELVLFPGEVSGEIALQKAEITAHRWISVAELSQYLLPGTAAVCEGLLPFLK